MDNSRESTWLDSVLGAIGNTPLIELSRIARGLNGRILAKLEYLNPGFSKKDRIALQMIEEAEAAGTLKPGQTVVELTSGNTGTGPYRLRGERLSVRGCDVEGNSTERARMIKPRRRSDPGRPVAWIDAGRVSGGDLALVEEAAQRIAWNVTPSLRSIHWKQRTVTCTPPRIFNSRRQIDALRFAGTGSRLGAPRCLRAIQPSMLYRRACRRSDFSRHDRD
jgi:cysteine synthase A